MFCPQCGSIQMPKKVDGKTVVMCANGHVAAGGGNIKISEHISEKKDFEVVEETGQKLPTTDDKCPKCGNRKAYFFTKQTRAADEPETKFMKCTKCGHQWRDYS